ncbi:MAG: class I SAM-dependent methyltransferase [Oscillospiraceae bacterium]|nr:class I SAM-dependent methyltransferase [Oscillospiraceae bacterium]
MRKYYEAYDERYKTVHAAGVSWASAEPTPIVLQTIEKYRLGRSAKMLEIGCGEGRDAKALLEKGYDLTATDISPEAIDYCGKLMPELKDRFRVLDCIDGKHSEKYDFIYSVAVIHMLVDDGDRSAFYRFIRTHLTPGGAALVCSMGDGKTEMKSDVAAAFEEQEREHPSGAMKVAATSCRMVTFERFEKEIEEAGLSIVEKGLTEALPEFDSLMYALVKRKQI